MSFWFLYFFFGFVGAKGPFHRSLMAKLLPRTATTKVGELLNGEFQYLREVSGQEELCLEGYPSVSSSAPVERIPLTVVAHECADNHWNAREIPFCGGGPVSLGEDNAAAIISQLNAIYRPARIQFDMTYYVVKAKVKTPRQLFQTWKDAGFWTDTEGNWRPPSSSSSAPPDAWLLEEPSIKVFYFLGWESTNAATGVMLENAPPGLQSFVRLLSLNREKELSLRPTQFYALSTVARLAHELGHALGLLHTFNTLKETTKTAGCNTDGGRVGDLIRDTPPISTSWLRITPSGCTLDYCTDHISGARCSSERNALTTWGSKGWKINRSCNLFKNYFTCLREKGVPFQGCAHRPLPFTDKDRTLAAQCLVNGCPTAICDLAWSPPEMLPNEKVNPHCPSASGDSTSLSGVPSNIMSYGPCSDKMLHFTQGQIDKMHCIIKNHLKPIWRQIPRSQLPPPLSGTGIKVISHSGDDLTDDPLWQIGDVERLIVTGLPSVKDSGEGLSVLLVPDHIKNPRFIDQFTLPVRKTFVPDSGGTGLEIELTTITKHQFRRGIYQVFVRSCSSNALSSCFYTRRTSVKLSHYTCEVNHRLATSKGIGLCLTLNGCNLRELSSPVIDSRFETGCEALYGGNGLCCVAGVGDLTDDGSLVQLTEGNDDLLQPPPALTDPTLIVDRYQLRMFTTMNWFIGSTATVSLKGIENPVVNEISLHKLGSVGQGVLLSYQAPTPNGILSVPVPSNVTEGVYYLISSLISGEESISFPFQVNLMPCTVPFTGTCQPASIACPNSFRAISEPAACSGLDPSFVCCPNDSTGVDGFYREKFIDDAPVARLNFTSSVTFYVLLAGLGSLVVLVAVFGFVYLAVRNRRPRPPHGHTFPVQKTRLSTKRHSSRRSNSSHHSSSSSRRSTSYASRSIASSSQRTPPFSSWLDNPK